MGSSRLAILRHEVQRRVVVHVHAYQAVIEPGREIQGCRLEDETCWVDGFIHISANLPCVIRTITVGAGPMATCKGLSVAPPSYVYARVQR